jgi:hypothetical protein
LPRAHCPGRAPTSPAAPASPGAHYCGRAHPQAVCRLGWCLHMRMPYSTFVVVRSTRHVDLQSTLVAQRHLRRLRSSATAHLPALALRTTGAGAVAVAWCWRYRIWSGRWHNLPGRRVGWHESMTEGAQVFFVSRLFANIRPIKAGGTFFGFIAVESLRPIGASPLKEQRTRRRRGACSRPPTQRPPYQGGHNGRELGHGHFLRNF